MRFFVSLLVGVFFTLAACAESTLPSHPGGHAKIETSMGDIIIELYVDEAPATVENFLQYAAKGQYDRTIFHRVIDGFVIQGGGFTKTFRERATRDPVVYEGDNGLKNERGTIAMARTSDPNSAAAQWFINLRDNDRLDHFEDELGPKFGYAVFGKVVEGMEIVDAIGGVETGAGGPFRTDVPVEVVLIERIDPVDFTVPAQ